MQRILGRALLWGGLEEGSLTFAHGEVQPGGVEGGGTSLMGVPASESPQKDFLH